MFRKEILLLYMHLIIIGCVENNTNQNIMGCTDPDALNYNLTATISDQSCEYNNESIVQPMPSIITSSKVLVSQYNDLSFNDIVTVPQDIDWISDTTLLSHGINSDYEVLDYWFICNFEDHDHPSSHKIYVSDANYLIKVKSTEEVYKLHFEDYSNGVVLFNFAKVNGENQSVTEVVTSNFYNESFYYNMITGLQDSINWHISLQKINVELLIDN